MPPPTDVIELRQYTLVPGRRQDLLDVFEGELVEPQEALGMHLVATFTDLDDPDRFVWMRSFADNATRTEALPAFYYGPVWKANSARANATMIDSDDVLLLRATGTGPQFPVPPVGAPPSLDAEPSEAVFAISVFALASGADEGEAVSMFAERVLPATPGEGADTVALLRTDPAENGFPALPVREGEHVLVWIRRFADAHVHAGLATSAAYERAIAIMGAPIQQLRLAPTRRSRLR